MTEDNDHKQTSGDRPTNSKGGKKGGKKGSKGGKSGYKGGPRKPWFNVDTELEKDVKSVEDLEEQEKKISENIEAKKEKIEELKKAKEDVDSEAKEKLASDIREKMEEKLAEKAIISEEFSGATSLVTAAQNKKKEIISELKGLKEELQRKKDSQNITYSAEDVVKAIKKVEQDHESTTKLSAKSERQFMVQLRNLEQIKKNLKGLEKYDFAISKKSEEIDIQKGEVSKVTQVADKKKAALKTVSTEYDKLKLELEDITNGGEQELRKAEQTLESLTKQRKMVNKKINYFKRKAQHEVDLVEWESNEAKRKEEAELRRQEAEERRKETDKDYREKLERQKKRDEEKAAIDKEVLELKKQDPWKDERTLCDHLINYLEKILGKKTAAETERQKTDKEKMEEAMKKIQGSCKVIGKGDDSDNFMKFKKPTKAAPVAKHQAPVAKGKPVKKVEEKKEEKPASTSIQHGVDKFHAFDDLKVDTPLTNPEAEETLEQLFKRRDWFTTAKMDDKFDDWRTKPAKTEEKKDRSDKEHSGGKGKGGKGKGKGGKKGGKKNKKSDE
eukprot:TRINITY_DN5280_c0_g1_i3.p1 TRINITY_DN5280_c0_g1~~TRINITY_DN5280_c0_g1_i3.p1  ORF type:complete len:572 (+),score=200.66 TRINITY_DN5280_c0_g1_i3:48-1718(+)